MMFGQYIYGLSEETVGVIVVAILGALGLIVPAAIKAVVDMARLNSKVDDLHQAVSTNHGKRPGEYLEMVAEIASRQVHVLESIGILGDNLDKHTDEDERRFQEVQQAIHELEVVTLQGNQEARERRGQIHL